jgi:hypothetical protein
LLGEKQVGSLRSSAGGQWWNAGNYGLRLGENDGVKETSIQNTDYFTDFLVLMAYLTEGKLYLHFTGLIGLIKRTAAKSTVILSEA